MWDREEQIKLSLMTSLRKKQTKDASAKKLISYNTRPFVQYLVITKVTIFEIHECSFAECTKTHATATQFGLVVGCNTSHS